MEHSNRNVLLQQQMYLGLTEDVWKIWYYNHTKSYNLRTFFSKELLKVKVSNKSGAGTDDVYPLNIQMYPEKQVLKSYQET